METILLAGLVVLLAAVFLYYRNPGSVVRGVFAADSKFQPIDVQEPHLRVDLLQNLQSLEYKGAHRNIFVEGPPPISPLAAKQADAERAYGPKRPPPPPPVQVPAEFFGTATMSSSGEKLAFFKDGDDVLVVQQGSIFLNRYRLIHIGNDSADVEEISSGRHATVPMVQPETAEQQPPQN
ncbi:MAG: hypothetical protein ACREAC_28260 [Blastocatellia bacterium]